MKLLLAAATEAEIRPTLEALRRTPPAGLDITPCITGVGLTAATFSLTRALCNGGFDFVLQAGIAGSFDRALPLGSVVVVAEEVFGDLGAEDWEAFLDVFDLGFEDRDRVPFVGGALPAPLAQSPFPLSRLQPVKGLTVQTVAGRAETVALRARRYGATLESMEGAALHYVALQLGVPFLQLRAVSNYVEPRNRAAWQIGPALQALNGQLRRWLL